MLTRGAKGIVGANQSSRHRMKLAEIADPQGPERGRKGGSAKKRGLVQTEKGFSVPKSEARVSDIGVTENGRGRGSRSRYPGPRARALALDINGEKSHRSGHLGRSRSSRQHRTRQAGKRMGDQRGEKQGCKRRASQDRHLGGQAAPTGPLKTRRPRPTA